MQVGSVFEYANKNAIFGVIQPDSGLYAPILGGMAITGLPSAGGEIGFIKCTDSVGS